MEEHYRERGAEGKGGPRRFSSPEGPAGCLAEAFARLQETRNRFESKPLRHAGVRPPRGKKNLKKIA